MILPFWRVLEAHYEIAESALFLEAVQTATAPFSLDSPVAEYNLQLHNLCENTQLVFRYEISTLFLPWTATYVSTHTKKQYAV